MVSCAGSAGGAAPSSQAQESASVKDAKHQEREQDKKALLEQMFVKFQNTIRMNVEADTLLALLTDSSEYWIDTLEQHARTYTVGKSRYVPVLRGLRHSPLSPL
jgi:hypothetical protein